MRDGVEQVLPGALGDCWDRRGWETGGPHPLAPWVFMGGLQASQSTGVEGEGVGRPHSRVLLVAVESPQPPTGD